MNDSSASLSPVHVPVLLKEVCENLSPDDGNIFIDGTLGLGGHAKEILSRYGEKLGYYYGFDVDREAVKISKENLAGYKNVSVIQANYRDAAGILENMNVNNADRVLLDLGVSSMQLDNPERGFSFRYDAPLNMRLDYSNENTVADYINTADESELADAIYELGEDKFARRIAKAIVETRNKKEIQTTFELRDIVASAYPARLRQGSGGRSKINPATKTFQALRILVNEELSTLQKGIKDFSSFLAPRGRMGIISFHSLEDRIVKRAYGELKKSGEYKLITKKPIIPSPEELIANPRCRSAKLRVIEKL